MPGSYINYAPVSSTSKFISSMDDDLCTMLTHSLRSMLRRYPVQYWHRFLHLWRYFPQVAVCRFSKLATTAGRCTEEPLKNEYCDVIVDSAYVCGDVVDCFSCCMLMGILTGGVNEQGC